MFWKKKFKQKEAKPKTDLRKSIRQFLKFTLVFGLLFTVVLTGIIAYEVVNYANNTNAITPESLILAGTSKVYDYNGKMIMTLSTGKNREVVKSKNVPENLKYAFVAIEDKRFYSHSGIDGVRIMGAIISFVTPGAKKYGASTITQQVVKNLTGDSERSLRRKIQELIRAIDLEKKLTKNQILEVYMNAIYMGGNCYGVQTASKAYFGKDVSKLSLAECASLAGITNNPALYAPISETGKANNIRRQKIILRAMLDCEFISQKMYDKAIVEKLRFAKETAVRSRSVGAQSYFVDQVVHDVKLGLVEKGYSESEALKLIYYGGIKICTTMDRNVQNAMDQVFQNRRYYSTVNKKAGQPQAAMVVLDAKNGQVRALYGGVGHKTGSVLNRASSSNVKRQPGSIFKPIAVYGPAINEGKITAATMVKDAPVYMDSSNPTTPYPQNYDHKYSGLITVQDAIRRSVNVVAAKVWRDFLGARMSLRYLAAVGIDRTSESYVSLALGGLNEGVNPMQMAAAYVPFANKGVYCKPVTYTSVEDRSGKIILRSDNSAVEVYKESTACIMTDMLRTVVRSGTAYPYGLIKGGAMPSAGKTGTTSDNKDKWFVGYTPYYVGVTWYGYDKPTPLSGAEYSRAMKIWHSVMEKVHSNLQNVGFQVSSDVVRVSICSKTGLLANSGCIAHRTAREEMFLGGTQPVEGCNIHAAETRPQQLAQ